MKLKVNLAYQMEILIFPVVLIAFLNSSFINL